MTYLDYINLFNRYDREVRLSDGATRLYIKLLDVANEVSRGRPTGAPWVVDFQRSDGYMAAVCGWSKNTVKKHRQELEKRGLVSGEFGQAGASSSGKYHLCYPSDNVSNVDTMAPVNVSNVDAIPALNVSTSDTLSPENASNVSENVSNVDTLYIEEERVVVDAADAATPLASSSKKPAAKKSKSAGATPEEIAALPLPFDGEEFATVWRTFYTTNPKQSGKNISAFELMLKKLAKYAEGYAVVMLERAIMGSWQGIENDGTARGYAEWQTQQARNPAPAPAPAAEVAQAPQMNPEFLAQQQEQEAARRAARLAELTAA